MRQVYDGPLGAGRNVFAWDGKQTRGTPAPSGIYFAQMNLGGEVQTKKMTLLK